MSPLIVLSGLPVGFEWISFFCLYSIENICSFFFFSFFDSENICSLKHHIFAWSWSIFFFIHSLLLYYIYVSTNHDNTYTHLTNNEFYSEANFVTIVFQDIYIYIYNMRSKSFNFYLHQLFRRKDDTLQP